MAGRGFSRFWFLICTHPFSSALHTISSIYGHVSIRTDFDELEYVLEEHVIKILARRVLKWLSDSENPQKNSTGKFCFHDQGGGRA